MLDDGSVVVAGGSAGEWDIPNAGDWDFAAFKLDADMKLLWKWQVAICKSRVFDQYWSLLNTHLRLLQSSHEMFHTPFPIWEVCLYRSCKKYFVVL